MMNMTGPLGTARSLRPGRWAALLAAQIVAAASAASPAAAWTETTLWSFTGGADGGKPLAGLALNSGILYGATFSGGANGQGVVFSIPTSGGTLSVLYTFLGNSSFGNGAGPAGTPILDGSNNILGTTAFTNLNSSGVGSGYGMVYELVSGTSGYSLNTLYNFTNGNDGAKPYAGLSNADSNGIYYGTATAGGSAGDGVIFKLTSGTGGSYTCCTTLYTFGGSDGVDPYGGVLLVRPSTLYGTTASGGGSTGYEGSAFKLSTSGGALTTLYSFSGSGAVGGLPFGGLFLVGNNVFGTTYLGGSSSGDGVVFKLTPPAGSGSYTYTNLHPFTGTNPDGASPFSSLIADGSNGFYGTTRYGGANGNGAVFQMVANAGGGYTYQTIYSFTGATDGANPYAAVYLDTATGYLYGTASSGGANGKGVVFKLTP